MCRNRKKKFTLFVLPFNYTLVVSTYSKLYPLVIPFVLYFQSIEKNNCLDSDRNVTRSSSWKQYDSCKSIIVTTEIVPNYVFWKISRDLTMVYFYQRQTVKYKRLRITCLFLIIMRAFDYWKYCIMRLLVINKNNVRFFDYLSNYCTLYSLKLEDVLFFSFPSKNPRVTNLKFLDELENIVDILVEFTSNR